MTIAINSNYLIKSAGNDYFNDYLVRMAALNPEQQFVFITPSAIDKQQIPFQNIINVISSPMGNNPLMWKIWLDYTLPRIGRKLRADIIIHPGGSCSLRTRIPQYLFISDLSFLYFPQFFSKKQLYFLKKNMLAFLVKATAIVTASGFLTKEIMKQYSIDEKKMSAFQIIAGDHYQPIGWDEKETIKEKYTDGKEYFLFSGEIQERNNLVNLLKAFSFFKKRQKSNMQLIISTKSVSGNDLFIKNFKTYKYRGEVNILMDLPEMVHAKITAAAYAFIYPACYDGIALFPLQAMQCDVPVITGNTGAFNEIAGEAALYIDPSDFEDIADKMMLVFKDETKRAELINKGKLVVQKNKADKINDLWCNSIFKTRSSY